MINDLITELVNAKITLNQALTKTKVVAYKINNSELKDWISRELNGYSAEDILPPYRIVPCNLQAKVSDGWREYRIPLDATELDKQFDGKFYKSFLRQSINTLEENVKTFKAANQQLGYEVFPAGIINQLRKQQTEVTLIEAGKIVQVSFLENVIETTKQKLLDTLLELNVAFPDFENAYQNTKENAQKTQTIITNNIYGGSSPINVGVGENIQQSNTVNITNEVNNTINELEKLGVDKTNLEDLKQIFSTKTDKATLTQKAMKWIGNISATIIEKGITSNLPAIIGHVHKLVESYS